MACLLRGVCGVRLLQRLSTSPPYAVGYTTRLSRLNGEGIARRGGVGIHSNENSTNARDNVR